MTSREPSPATEGSATPSELPADDLPSPEILDELLKAFAADAVDTGTLRTIDLASPEVEELLAPTAPTPSPDEPESQPQVEGEVEVETSQSDARPDVEPEPAGTPSGTIRTIHIDASDDPPDAVYLAAGDPLLAPGAMVTAAAPSAAPTSREGTVFIDDQDVGLGETISIADASAATRIEPRLRERRIAVKRAAGRKRLRWALIAVGVVVVVIAGLAVLGSSLFAVHTVEVDGAVYTDKAALQQVVDELDGTPVLRVDTSKLERQLEAIPWVEAARVTTDFPNRATIELRERTPAATYQGSDGRFRVLDGEGRVLDVLEAQPTDHLLLVGADAPDLEAGQFAPRGYVAAASMARALTPGMRARAESATVTADGSDLRLMLQGGVEVRFGPARDLVVKLVRLQTKLDELAAGGFQYVDVSTNEVTTG